MHERDAAKKVYEPPMLIIEGDVTALTSGGVDIGANDLPFLGSQ